MADSGIVLIGDPRVTAIEVRESNEPLVDLLPSESQLNYTVSIELMKKRITVRP